MFLALICYCGFGILENFDAVLRVFAFSVRFCGFRIAITPPIYESEKDKKFVRINSAFNTANFPEPKVDSIPKQRVVIQIKVLG